ncbi:MAG: hypothetical protein LBR86_00630 [Tannerella sp.]|jgi:predicted AAA+ superfamily ATPase|nr:hypothetical protein [Tannerella sp.]
MIETSTRLHGVEELIAQKQYFVIHAARQSGKTTYLQDLTQRLNAEGKYYALYCSLESVQNIVEPEQGIPAIISCIKGRRENNYDNRTLILPSVLLIMPCLNEE